MPNYVALVSGHLARLSVISVLMVGRINTADVLAGISLSTTDIRVSRKSVRSLDRDQSLVKRWGPSFTQRNPKVPYSVATANSRLFLRWRRSVPNINKSRIE